jgi:hypothetical protein
VPDDHPDYRDCTDADCPRFPCRVYREGHQDGRELGYREGEAETYPVAWIEGFAAGAATCAGR